MSISFPFIPVPGESFHSVTGRFLHSTAGVRSGLLQHIGVPLNTATALAPLKVSGFPHGHPWHNGHETIIRQHTLFPAYHYFSDPNVAQERLEDLLAGRTSSHRIGNTNIAGSMAYEYGRFCRDCLREDLERGHPVGYVHHAPLAVKLCHRHKVPLNNHYCPTCASSRLFRRSDWRMTGMCTCPPPQNDVLANSKVFADHVWFSRQIHYLCGQGTIGEQDNLRKLRQLLFQNGYYRGPKMMDLRKLAEKLEQRYGFLTLASFGLTPNQVIATNSRALRPSITNLCSCVLMCGLVCENVSELNEVTLDAVSEGVPLASEKAFSTQRSRAGELTESDVRRFLEQANGKYTRAAVLAGVPPQSFQHRARELMVEVPLPARQAERLGTELISNVLKAVHDGMWLKDVAKTFDLRSDIINRILMAYPQAMSQRASGVNQSPKLAGTTSDRRRGPRVLSESQRAAASMRFAQRWAARDDKLAAKVEETAKNMLAQVPAVRLSKLALFRNATGTQYKNCWLHRALLPAFTTKVASVSETKERFQQRKILIALAKLKERGESASVPKLVNCGVHETVIRANLPFVIEALKGTDIAVSARSRLYLETALE